MYLPLIVSDQRLGVLGVSRPDAYPYAERELWLLQALANHLAQATAKAQTHQALQETAALNARLYREAQSVRSYLNALIHTTPDLLVTMRDRSAARILLVEDEELVRTVVTRTLTRNNYDMQMPGMDGAALYKRLHRERPSLRWLILTGDTLGERSRTFLKRTNLPALAKPFTREQL